MHVYFNVHSLNTHDTEIGALGDLVDMRSFVIGVEIGGTKLQAVLGTTDGEIIARRRASVDPKQGASGILRWLEATISQIMEEAPAHGVVAGIGVGFGGPVESRTGRVLTSHQIEGWDGILLKEWMETRSSLPTVVENDANAAGWAEYCHGAGKGTQNFVYCNIGSGIGGALVLDGQLYNGQGYGACEIGHTYIADWTASKPGAVDKLEHLCSGWSITRRIRAWENVPHDSILGRLCDGESQKLTCPMLADAARQGDSVALKEVMAIAWGVGEALTNVITLLHPERIAMGGGVSLMGDILLDGIRDYIAQHVFGAYQGKYALLPCALEEDVVTVGTLLLAANAGSLAQIPPDRPE